VFIGLFSFIVLIHEGGHFFWARRFGVTVYEFAIGFGPVLLQTKRKDVLYSLRAIPLGGFCKIAGTELVLEGESKEPPPNVKLFSDLSLGRKLLIILGGPLNNLLCALITFVLIAAVLGLPAQLQSDRAVVGFVEPNSPAFEAGLATGDEIVSLDGQPISRWEQLSGLIHQATNQKLRIEVKRKSEFLIREITPVFDAIMEGAKIGIYPAYTVRRLPWLKAVRYGVTVTGRQVLAVPLSLVQMLTGRVRPQFIGPLGMVGVIDQALKSGLYLFFTILASFNLFLGIFNLLPIPLPLLDGGWILIYLLEGLSRKEFKPEQKAVAQLIGVVMMTAFYLTVILSDFASIIRRLIPKS
jgi:regulator of sigma E protease